MIATIALQPLFAKVGDFLEILIPVVIFLIVMVGKILNHLAIPQRPGGPVNRPPQPPRQPGQAPQPPVQAPRPKTVQEEIDEFLRRTAQKKISQPASAEPVRRISPSAAPRAKRSEPVAAEVVREKPIGGAVSEHVKKYLDEKEFDKRAAKLGGDVAAADTKIERHLKEVFGHGISKLASKPGESAAAPAAKSDDFFQDASPALPAAGAGLAMLLGNVDNLRQAIVLNEILQRPIDRWS